TAPHVPPRQDRLGLGRNKGPPPLAEALSMGVRPGWMGPVTPGGLEPRPARPKAECDDGLSHLRPSPEAAAPGKGSVPRAAGAPPGRGSIQPIIPVRSPLAKDLHWTTTL